MMKTKFKFLGFLSLVLMLGLLFTENANAQLTEDEQRDSMYVATRVLSRADILALEQHAATEFFETGGQVSDLFNASYADFINYTGVDEMYFINSAEFYDADSNKKLYILIKDDMYKVYKLPSQ
jgi:hypothetical protein